MGLLDSATTAVDNITRSLSTSGPASALSSIGESIGAGLSGISNIVGNILSGNVSNVTAKLPMPNMLSPYASYNCIFTLSVLDDDTYNFPDKTYMQGRTSKGGPLPIILKSGSGDPSNRVTTVYGKFDFLIDDVNIESIIGLEKGNNTNATNISFKVFEPYSMGLFLMSLQTAAYQLGHKNWKDAPYLLTIDFEGALQTGVMQKIPYTKRCIPIKLTDLTLSTDSKGSVYEVNALPYNEQAFGKTVAGLKTDVSVSGTTVQEALQSGEKSLQATINARYKQIAKDNGIEVPDEIVILFPIDVASEASGSKGGSEESKDGATTNTAATDIEKKLGLSRSSDNGTLVQKKEEVNIIGKSSLGFDNARKGATPMAKDNQVYDTTTGIFKRGNITIDPKSNDFKFSQNSDVTNAINQVIMASKYPADSLDPSNLTPEGFREWWRIETQVYIRTSDANLTSTGVKPKVYVYRIVPYKAHASKVLPQNTTAPGMAELKKQAVKKYDYLYMGSNTEVLKFEIQYSGSFISLLAADGGTKTMDVTTGNQTSVSDKDPDTNIKPLQKGEAPPAPGAGAVGAQVSYAAVKARTDLLGGGGPETEAQRAARLFHDAITEGVDMQNLTLEILGDPFWIAQSGHGNYTSTPTQYTNLNKDATVNYQNGEVDVIVDFRTPTDINQATGLYNFNAPSGVAQFSGLYSIKNVTSRFSQGKFTQTLFGMRRKGQPQDNPASTPDPTKTFNSATPSTVKPEEKQVISGSEGE